MKIRQYMINKGYTPFNEDNGLTLYLKGSIPNKKCFYNAFIELDEKTLEIKDYGLNVDALIGDEMEYKRLVYLYKDLDKVLEAIRNRRGE